MFIETREYKKIGYELELELEQMFKPFQTRKDSSFHTKDKSDYSILFEDDMKRDNIKKQ